MSDSSSVRREKFRTAVMERRGLLMPGAFNALSARVIADTGFTALYVTGAGVTNMSLGLPDLGFIGLSDIAEHTSRIREVIDLPILVDADTGFGNALNVRHTVRTLERAGADAIQFEDQVSPKKCGHFSGKAVISTAEMVGKLHAATDAREDPNVLIVARTDACAVHGFDEAIERANRFAEAGADVLFVEAVETFEQIKRLPSLVQAPQLVNLVVGGKTPVVPQPMLAQFGFGIVLYANAALQSAIAGMKKALTTLQQEGTLDEDPEILAPFSERQRLVDKPFFDLLERQYTANDR
ncbi:carboxyvinyl-carboxyphosphonate phosphorylmutase [Burkholderia aenigmatica]|uniref:Carboxyvinyl-carboxyphosphonate phosphorylmutase n=1 Tax=Burkholderia aenigmatica TaxID=2015348 RepID=A0A6P2I5B0_9BURK|nr:oxaloacetate decarboxylase [Burkholderia aenigmatica]VWB24567.1 carboxyvinyl-carboxyphosphonate phosphorylmutase [Burkholderia aenigmatica]